MLNIIKKLFSNEEDSSSYVNHKYEDIEHYREKYPDIEISEVKLPELETDKWFTIRKWFKKDGDWIVKNERICLVETDSFELELEAYVEGYIYFRQRPKQELQTGRTICVILQKKIN